MEFPDSSIARKIIYRKHIHIDKCGRKVVFTNGCFDLLHYGHLSYLAQAKKLGDILIVGVNNDDSIQRLKGINRPINDIKTRLFQIACLEFVDLVVPFSEDTPERLIEDLKPDILVKGGDYTVDQIVGADIVRKYWWLVMALAIESGYSSTNIINKILKK